MDKQSTKKIILLTAKEIAVLGLMTALLLGGQYVLSFVAGVEIVTAFLLAFSYSFGWKRGITVATAFSLLRCFIFGFFFNVVLLYLIYFNLFALFWGSLGKKIKFLPAIVLVAMLCTVCFTLIDDILWPLIGGLTAQAAWVYFLASFTAMIPQTVCTLVTVSLLFYPLTKIFDRVAKSVAK